MKPAKRYSAYRITHSSVETIPVGRVLVDTGNRLQRDWTFIDRTSGDLGTCVGARIEQLCPDCVVEHKRAAVLHHDGEHGPDAPTGERS